MRRAVVLLFAPLVLAVLLFAAVPGCAPPPTASQEVPAPPPTAAQESPAKPNFVFILADDMREDDLKYMPKTRSLLRNQGMQFKNAYVPYGMCCPSRASILTGMYTHNHKVWTNSWETFSTQGHEEDNMATRMRAAGYRTGLFGKYFNRYEGTNRGPRGWDDWFAKFHGVYYDYDVNDNGTIKHYGKEEREYSTEVLSKQTQEFVEASVVTGKPFFAYVAPNAPHRPFTPAPRHRDAFNGEKAPHLPSFNEEDVSDKPPWIQELPSLSTEQIAQIDERHEARVETLQALDELVAAVVNKLSRVGELENTYLFFTSDNGWHHGEHRIPDAKGKPYEESIHMPLLVRGPGVQAGSTTNKLVLNTDFLPTFTDLAGTATPSYVDGRSLRPVLEGSATTWRTAILLERQDDKNPDAAHYGIRTSTGKKYVEYEGGFKELYDLRTDPYELVNSFDASAPPADLAARLAELKGCAGPTCRTAEDGVQPVP